MSDTVRIDVNDDINCVVHGLSAEHNRFLYDKFTMDAPNYFFHPLYKLGQWDGKVRFYKETGKTYTNLLDVILKDCKKFGYKINLVDHRNSQCVYPDLVDENYFSHILDPKSGEPYILGEHQVTLINKLLDAGDGIGLAATGSGKAQPLTAKILTPYGWKVFGELKINDLVLTPDNKLSNIIGIYPQGKKDIYEITFHDGSKVRCCADHLFKIKYNFSGGRQNKRYYDIMSLSDIIEKISYLKTNFKSFRHAVIPITDKLSFIEQEITIDPYILGCLIGDGCLRNNTISISTNDDEIVKYFNNVLSNDDLCLIQRNRYDYYIRNKKRNRVNILKININRYGLLNKKSYEKFIPQEYLYNTIEIRTALLSGLLDTDGHIGKHRNHIQYTTTSKILANQVKELVCGLGGIASISETKKKYNYKGEKIEGRISYILHITFNNPIEFFKISRKRNRCKLFNGGKSHIERRISDIKYIGKEEAQCIMIDDPNHLYITDDYIITHNTIICGALICQYWKHFFKTLIIVPDKNLISQTHRDLSLLGIDVGKFGDGFKELNHNHLVSTWQSLKNSPNVINPFKVIIVDECHGVRGNVLQKLITDHACNLAHRFGVTGTLPKHQTEALNIKIALGPVRYTIPAKELIEKKWLSNLDIEVISLELFHPEYKAYVDEIEKSVIPQDPMTYLKYVDSHFVEYADEKEFLMNKKERLEWIRDFIIECSNEEKGNVLCLVSNIKFGKKLSKMIPDSIFVYGKDDVEDREKVYALFADNNNLRVIANVQVASTGLNIHRIFNLVYIDIGKSFIRVIQTIGRGLRKASDKDYVRVYDICSNAKYGRKHLSERIKYYNEAGYNNKKRIVKLMSTI